MLCILNPILPPFWKITKILMEQKNMMSLTNDVHWNVCHLKSKVWKSQRFENQVFFMLLLYQMMHMCCWPLKANGWKQLCKCQSLHSLIWLIQNRRNFWFQYAIMINSKCHPNMPLLVFKKISNISN
jgi:hypothetical protein